MKIYLDKSLESIKVFGDLVTLLRGIVTDPTLMSSIGKLEDIYTVSHVYDPVRDFIEFYLTDGKVDWTEERKFYVLNALYAAKGNLNLFDVMSETFEVKVTYDYNFPVLNLIQFEGIVISNLDKFVEKFTNALYYLLYYTELTIKFKELILSINDNVNIFLSVLSEGYRIHQAKLE